MRTRAEYEGRSSILATGVPLSFVLLVPLSLSGMLDCGPDDREEYGITKWYQGL